MPGGTFQKHSNLMPVTLFVILDIVAGNVKGRWLPSAGPVDNSQTQSPQQPSEVSLMEWTKQREQE